MVKAVFFDNDGILVDTERLYFQATQRVLESKGVTLTETRYIEYFLRQGKGAWFLLEKKGILPEEIEALKRQRNRIYAGLLHRETILIDGVTEALKRLYGKVMLCIVTSSARDHFEVIHRRTGLLPYFDFYLTEGDYEKTKPAPDPYLKALEKSGLQPDDCIVVEDSERGLLAANAAGLRCIAVPRGMTRDGDFKSAHMVAATLSEAVDVILR